jgi:transcriptional regulator with XRE-family HTH domain
MLAQWICDLVGKMHKWKISKKELAAELDVTPEYVSMILNGHREPTGAKEKFEAALGRLIERKKFEAHVAEIQNNRKD